MPSRRSNGCADTVILFATFLDPCYRRSYCPVMPYLLDERSSTRLGSVKKCVPNEIFLCTTRKTLAGQNLLQTSSACFENGWHGRPARAGRRPADRNCGEQRCEKAVLIGSNCRSRSVRRVAGRHRRVACATANHFSNTVLGLKSHQRHPLLFTVSLSGHECFR